MQLREERLTFVSRFSSHNLLVALVVLVLGIFVAVNVSDAYAQQKGKKSKTSAKKKSPPVKADAPDLRTELINSLDVLCIPRQSETSSVIQIDANSKLTATVQTKNDSKVLADGAPVSSLPEILSRIDKKSVVTFKADPTLSFKSIADALQKMRRATENCINVESLSKTDNQYVYIAPEPLRDNGSMNVKPNPLTLIVELKPDKKITLNADDEGSLNDTSTLSNKLKEIFAAREENGVFREGTNEVEKTIFIKAPLTAKFADVIKIIEAVKEAGATPVGLQIDDLGNSTTMPSVAPSPQIKEKS